MRKSFEGCLFDGSSGTVMFRIKDCNLVFVLFALWLVLGKTQFDRLRNNSNPFLLAHRKDSKTYSPAFWYEILSGSSSMSGFSQAVV